MVRYTLVNFLQSFRDSPEGGQLRSFYFDFGSRGRKTPVPPFFNTFLVWSGVERGIAG